MAEFNPQLPQPSIPDWTNAPGRLIDGSGVGDIFAKVAVVAADTYKNEKEKAVANELYASADAAAEAGRLDSLASSGNIPPDIAKSMDKAALYKKAFENGNYSDTTFYTKMDVWAKEMKSKYPQYRDLIDQQLGRVMGRTPANMELDSARKMYEDDLQARSASASKDQTFLSEHSEFLSQDEVVQFQTGTDETKQRLKTKAIILKGDKARLQSEWNQLEQNSKAGALEAGPVLSQTVANIQREFYLGAIDKGGGSLQSLRQTIARMREGGFTPEETAQAEALINDAKVNLQQKWVAATTTPGENGKSLQDYFASDPSVWNAQKAKLDEMVGSLDGLLTGKSGIFEWNATMESASVNARAAKIRDQMGAEAYDGFKSIVDLVGQDQANLVYQNLALDKGDPIADMMAQTVFGTAVKKADIGTAVETIQSSVDPSLRSAFNEGTRNGVEAIIKTAVDDSLPVEARAKAIDAILGDTENKFLRSLKDTPDNTGLSSREKAFKRLASPEMAQAAKAAGKEVAYTEWVKRSAVALYSGNVEQVNATNVNSKAIDIAFNPKTMQFEATFNPAVVKNPQQLAAYIQARNAGKSYAAMNNMPKDIPLADLDNIKAGLDSIQKLNMINQALVEALKSEQPGISSEDLAKELQIYMGDLKASYSKEDPWQTRALNAIGTYFAENSAFTGGIEKGSKADQKSRSGEDFGVVPQGDANFNMIEDSRSALPDQDAASILAFVSHAEGADYGTLFGGQKADLEGMTVAEVQALQRKHGKATGSSATGAYQVMRKTLSDLIDQGVVDPDEPFSEDVQNRIGMALLERRGYEDWKSGKLTTEEFTNRLALEWASLPGANGRSAYEGVMNNKSTTDRTSFVTMLESLKG